MEPVDPCLFYSLVVAAILGVAVEIAENRRLRRRVRFLKEELAALVRADDGSVAEWRRQKAHAEQVLKEG